MKKVLSVLLATLMFFTLLMPCALAANGPAPIDWEEWANVDTESLDMTDLDVSFVTVIDYENEEMGYLYPDEIAAEAPVTVKGISYDKATNTLTLNNVRLPYAGIGIAAMGDDFKIKLIGYNELGTLGTASLSWGCSTTLVGDGELVVNKKLAFTEALNLDFTGVENGFFKASKSVALKLCGIGEQEYSASYPSVVITGAPEKELEDVLILEGKVKENITCETLEYVENIYEQEEFYCLSGFFATDFFKRKSDGKLFVGKRIVEGHYATDYFTLYSLEYDEFLDVYIVRRESGLERIIPSKSGFQSCESIDSSKLAFCSNQRKMMNIGYTENGEKCVFVESYYYEDFPDMGKETFAYPIVDHPEFGMTVLGYTKDNGEFTVSEKTFIRSRNYYNHTSYNSTITMNNGGSVLLGKVTLKKAENAYGGVNVTWNAVSGADSYTIYRKAAGAKSWSTLGTSKTTSYLDKTAKTGTKYTYTVRAKNIVGLGSYDKTGVSTTYIAAPTVKIANATNGIKVSWNKISGATGYKIYRAEYVNGKWTGWKSMGNTNAKTSAWTDKSVKSGVAYKYTVRTISNKLASGYKASSAIRFLSVPTVKIQNASTGVKVIWNKISGAKNYTIYRSEYNASTKKWSSWKNLGTVGAVTSHIDTTASSGVYYKYTVRAVNGGSKGAYKESAQLLYLAQPTTKIANASNGIKVSWNKISGAKNYTVYRSTYSNGKWSGWQNMGNVAATKTSWVDKSIKSGVQYKYTVRAVNGKVKSTYKATAGLVRLQQPAVKVALNENSVKVSWNKISGAKSYTVYRAELVDGKWSSWTNISSQTALSFTDSAVTEGATYRYTVRAVNGKSSSSYKASANVIIPAVQEDVITDGVFITPTGSRYHFDKDCGGENSTPTTLEEATKLGYTPCQKCAQ